MPVDERLAHGDLSLVSDIAQMKFGEKSRFNLSFASKYCSWHQPTPYQIYDGVVNQMLWNYQETLPTKLVVLAIDPPVH